MKMETMNRLEFETMKEHLHRFAMSHLGRAAIEQLEPSVDKRAIERLLDEAEEAVKVIEHGSSVPIPSLEGVEPVVQMLGKGYMLSEHDLMLISRLIESTRQLKRYMLSKETVAPRVSAYATSLHDLKELKQELDRCIQHGKIADQASSELAKIRKKIVVAEERIKKKLDGAMSRYKAYLQEHIVSMRGERYVLAVKKEYRKQVNGSVLDESSSGQTVFIEPADIAPHQAELAEQRMEEAREEAIILGELTELTERFSHEIGINLETIGHYDFLFAKAKYARSINGRKVALNEQGHIRLVQAKHPLLGAAMVPLDCTVGHGYRSLIITGPNTGGKTVCLKTIGLLTMMAQSGLLVPVEEGSVLAVYRHVLADIGDGQSLAQSLSTFSSHITNVKRILDVAGPSTLVLLDELATGTDPGEGIGLSIAVLEELYKRGSTVVATTHYNEIKEFASRTKGFRNARMEFDTETLRPLYRLTIGEAGSSYAFYIAKKLGIPESIIERSKQITAASRAQLTDAGEVVADGTRKEDEASEIPREPEGTPDRKIAAPHAATQDRKLAQLPGAETPNEAEANTADTGKPQQERPRRLEVGDCVWISSLKRTGILQELPDARGNALVLIQKEKVRINIKRLSLYIERKQLYPGEDYDMDIVFESKDVRKKRKLMSRKYVKDVTIVHPPEE